MTAITRPGTEHIRRDQLSETIRRRATAVLGLARQPAATIARIAAAGQLGPMAETERGRWTGGRV